MLIDDNISSNNIEEDVNSGNLTSTISDHYAQFLPFENTNSQKKALPLKNSSTASNPWMKKNLNLN